MTGGGEQGKVMAMDRCDKNILYVDFDRQPKGELRGLSNNSNISQQYPLERTRGRLWKNKTIIEKTRENTISEL